MRFYFQEVQADRENERLDKFLRRTYPEVRLSAIQKFIRSGKIMVDGKRVKDGAHRLIIGQKVLIKMAGNQDEIKQRYGRTPPEHIPFELELSVLYEDGYMVILNKPVGIPVQPGTKTSNKSIYNALLSYNTEFYLVHRLDKYTSGVLVVSKNYEFTKELSELFKTHKMKKEYLALVHGLVKEHMEFDEPIDDRDALTIVEPKEFFNGYTLLTVNILTGRKHQIRRHLASNGTPVVGDNIYGKVEENADFKRKYGLEGYFLHCNRISFTHPKKGNFVTMKAPLPENRKKILEALRREM